MGGQVGNRGETEGGGCFLRDHESVLVLRRRVVEHLDAGGYSANFLDMAGLYLGYPGSGYLSFENMEDSGKKEGLIRNRQIPALMVPPEHRSKVAALVREMNALVQDAV